MILESVFMFIPCGKPGTNYVVIKKVGPNIAPCGTLYNNNSNSFIHSIQKLYMICVLYRTANVSRVDKVEITHGTFCDMCNTAD